MLRRIESSQMPPPPYKIQVSPTIVNVRPVSKEEIAILRQWIAAGAPAPDAARAPEREATAALADKGYWAFHPPRRPPEPRVRQSRLVRNPVDAFLLDKLEAKGLTFSPPAPPTTLVRRAFLDLTGLPPEPRDVDSFAMDRSPEAWERLIDRLLASPHYGERWGKFWLDASGYTDSAGSVDADPIQPHAYRYRDYVIRSFNADKPYDRFLLEQIAGDELFDFKSVSEPAPEQHDQLAATGFLRTAEDGSQDVVNTVPYRWNVLADQLQIFSSAVLGLTVGCARCHGHKYDPITHTDYYRMAAIFQTAYDPYEWVVNKERHLSLIPGKERRDVQSHNRPLEEVIRKLEHELKRISAPFERQFREEKLASIPAPVRADLLASLEIPVERRDGVQQYLVKKFEAELSVNAVLLAEKFPEYKLRTEPIRRQIEEARARLIPEPKIRALFDMGGEPTPAYVSRRGEALNVGHRVDPGVPSVLNGPPLVPYTLVKPRWDTSGRRLALARWLTQPNHPLTGRAMVNRIWQHHFGAGLVSTPDNFGSTGSPPSHPELLDWLATEFVRRGWSVKEMHRLMMTSTAYRQASRVESEQVERADPLNELLSRYPMRRMDAETIRDSILKVAGRLDRTPFGPADPVQMLAGGEVVSESDGRGRRSVYVLQRRSRPLTLLESFDAPRMTPNCVKRVESTVVAQALALWNSGPVRQLSRYFAKRLIDEAGGDPARRIELAFRETLGRRPTGKEATLARESLAAMMRHWSSHLAGAAASEPRPVTEAKAQWLALAAFCHTLWNSPEFAYID